MSVLLKLLNFWVKKISRYWTATTAATTCCYYLLLLLTVLAATSCCYYSLLLLAATTVHTRRHICPYIHAHIHTYTASSVPKQLKFLVLVIDL